MIKNLWPDDILEAKKVQDILKKRVKITFLKKIPKLIAGVDAAFAEGQVIAVATLYEYPRLKHCKDTVFIEEIRFPYVPGMLSFREGHAIVGAIEKLDVKPDVILFDGHGIAHPKGIGIASHIGVILGIPSIGCAKSILVGEYDEPDIAKGSWTYLYYKGEKVGAVLRTRTNVKPLFVSPGHLIDIVSSVEIVKNCISKYRIPEPIRRADWLSSQKCLWYS